MWFIINIVASLSGRGVHNRPVVAREARWEGGGRQSLKRPAVGKRTKNTCKTLRKVVGFLRVYTRYYTRVAGEKVFNFFSHFIALSEATSRLELTNRVNSACLFTFTVSDLAYRVFLPSPPLTRFKVFCDYTTKTPHTHTHTYARVRAVVSFELLI